MCWVRVVQTVRQHCEKIAKEWQTIVYSVVNKFSMPILQTHQCRQTCNMKKPKQFGCGNSHIFVKNIVLIHSTDVIICK